MAQISNHDRNEEEPPTQSKYAFNLPSRQSYFTTLSAIAFASGLGIAAIVTIRRGRKMRLEETQKGLEKVHTTHIQTLRPKPVKNDIEVLNQNPLGRASSKGVLSLFGEMNRSIFKRKKENEQGNENPGINATPSALLKRSQASASSNLSRGKSVQDSVFDASPLAPPPSVLMRPSKTTTPKPELTSVRSTSASETSTVESTEESAEESTGDSPVLLAIKAIGMATAIVGAAAYISVQIACKVFKVNSMDELIEHLTTIVPKSERNEVFDKIGKSARQSLEGRMKIYEKSSDLDLGSAYSDELLRKQEQQNEPLPVQEAMEKLDDAIERGDAAAWMEILSKQLNAERRKDLQDRQIRIEKASGGLPT